MLLPLLLTDALPDFQEQSDETTLFTVQKQEPPPTKLGSKGPLIMATDAFRFASSRSYSWPSQQQYAPRPTNSFTDTIFGTRFVMTRPTRKNVLSGMFWLFSLFLIYICLARVSMSYNCGLRQQNVVSKLRSCREDAGVRVKSALDSDRVNLLATLLAQCVKGTCVIANPKLFRIRPSRCVYKASYFSRFSGRRCASLRHSRACPNFGKSRIYSLLASRFIAYSDIP